jgi:hypothetical protein
VAQMEVVMKVELRKVKVCKFASEETTCYQAEVWVDGVLVGHSRNDGKGGCDMVDHVGGRDVRGLLDAAAAALPPRQWPAQVGGGSRTPDWETVLNDALDVALARKDFERELKKRVLLVADGKLTCTKVLKAPAHATALAHFKSEGRRVLNALPFEEAFPLWYGFVAPEGHPLRKAV